MSKRELKSLKTLSSWQEPARVTRSGNLMYHRAQLSRKQYKYTPFAGIGDTEQDGKKRVFSWTVLQVEKCVNTNKVKVSGGMTIYFNDIIEIIDSRYKRRYTESITKNKEMGWDYLHVSSFRDGMDKMVHYINDYCNGVLIHHCILQDIQNLKITQNVLKSIGSKNYRFFKKDTGNTHKGNICYNRFWDNIKYIDSCKWMKPEYSIEIYPDYIGWLKSNNIAEKSSVYYNTRLETFSKFIRKDPHYKQKHDSVNDSIDLVQLIGHRMFVKSSDFPTFDMIEVRTPWASQLNIAIS